ncbi:hypothetical protein PPROV_001107800 [Pycnococcus provasolii]|uniref:Cyanobacterial aminoacyl-tRNA synthetase CAAD domain-containing protein n=1 Tax=Pycnococcus provasolii TaxID=41880 RepID=A0A830I2U0_9CHLO|nr:hypothetical protein PPROV_001107800 [Pycnococcus provasolii]
MAPLALPSLKTNAAKVVRASVVRASSRAVSRSAAIRSPVAVRQTASTSRPVVAVHAKSSGVSEKAEEIIDKASKAWDEVEEKPAAIALGTAAIIALWATSSVVDAIEKLPLFSGLFELVGIGYTGYFVYRYLLFKPDREELKEIVDDFVKKIFE